MEGLKRKDLKYFRRYLLILFSCLRMRYLVLILISSSLGSLQLVGTFWPVGGPNGGENSCLVRFSAGKELDGTGRYVIFINKTNNAGAGLYYGGTDWDTVIDDTLRTYEIDYAGYPNWAFGYVNADSFVDLIISRYFYDSAVVWVWFGGPNFDDTFDMRLIVDLPGNDGPYGLGFWCTTGDLNGDGYDEIIIAGGAVNTGGLNNRGAVAIWLGGSLLDDSVDYLILGEAENTHLGENGIATGDINGDGYEDLLVSRGVSANQTRIYLGGNPFDTDYDYALPIGSVRPPSAEGDFNGDGYNDIVGIVPDTVYGNDPVRFFYGGNPFDPTQFIQLPYPAMGVGIIKDLNGDGYDELVLGAIGTERVLIYYGRDTLTNFPFPADEEIWHPYDRQLEGDHDFGWSVVSAGDFTGDGVNDLIVTAPWATNPCEPFWCPYAGRAYLYAGEIGIKEKEKIKKQNYRIYEKGNKIEIESDLNKEIKIEVFDVTGRKIGEVKGYKKIIFNKKSLPSTGTYFLHIKYDGKAIKKIIKLR